MRVSIAYLAKVAAWSELPRAQVITTRGRAAREAPRRCAPDRRAARFLPRDSLGRFGGFPEHFGGLRRGAARLGRASLLTPS